MNKNDLTVFLLNWNIKNFAPQLESAFGRATAMNDTVCEKAILAVRQCIKAHWPKGSKKILASYLKEICKERANGKA